MLNGIREDIRVARRVLQKNRGFTTAVVLTLALGIASNTAVFSVVNRLLLQPSPYADGDDVSFVLGWSETRDALLFQVPSADFVEWAQNSKTFQDMAAYRAWSVNLADNEQPERVQGYRVSANTFKLLGVTPALGRTFTQGDGELGSDRVVLMSHGLWKRRYGLAPQIIGHTVRLNGIPFTVIGVMPEQFDFPQYNFRGELWTPLVLADEERVHAVEPVSSVVVVARLKPGGEVLQAQIDIDNICRRLEALYPNSNRGFRGRVVRMRDMALQPVRLALRALFIAVAGVLFIACVNVGGIMTIHILSRSRELAVRAALGASRRQMVRQLFCQSLVLALAAGAVGLLLAQWQLDLFRAYLPDFITEVVPAAAAIGISPRVAVFSLLLSLACSLVFGLAPALRHSSTEVVQRLKDDDGTTAVGSPRRLRAVMTSGGIAVALTVLAAAGLMARSALGILALSPGFDPVGVTTFSMTLPSDKYPDAARQTSFEEALLSRLAGVPAAARAAVVSTVPFSTFSETIRFMTAAQEGQPPSEYPQAGFDRVSPDYFQVMRIPVIHGRTFTAHDDARGAAVAIISQAIARKLWLDRNPLGDRLRLGTSSSEPWRTIIGVVGDVRDSQGIEPRGSIEPEIYVPFDQAPRSSFAVVIRSSADLKALLPSVREQLQQIDPDQPVYQIKTLEDLLRQAGLPLRYLTAALLLFGFQALLLSAVGLYGLVAYSVTQRKREIGIRMALGADRAALVRLLLRRGLALTVIGTLAGIGTGRIASRSLQAALTGVAPNDPWTLYAAAALMATVSFGANYLPVRRAVRLNPTSVFRNT